MALGWSCQTCTYRHEAKESAYLTCAMCASPRPSAPEKGQVSKRRNNLLHHFPTVDNKQQEQHGTKRQRTTTTTSPIHNKVTTTSVTTNPPQHTRRSILDALKPCRASSFVPRARYRDHPKAQWIELGKDEEIPKLCPMTIIRDVLPVSMASKLLEQLEAESATWNRGNWIIHGKEHQIPRTTATYNLTAKTEQNGPMRYGDEPHYSGVVKDGEDDDDEEDDEYLDQRRAISPELRQAANCISELVQRYCPWAVANENQDWEPTFAFANRYANGQECVGWHADHITPLGPRPIIVGLSLGACRRFDLRQMPSTAKDKKNNSKSQCSRHVSVPLPHNSVAIMWNDAQESWQHSVPRCSDDSIMQHPRVGTVRISLTFRKRRQLPDFGNCHCGRPAGLKAKDGRYYLFCRPYGKDKNKTCVFWKPCPWAEEEAKRLVQLEVATKHETETTTASSTIANKTTLLA